MTPRNAHRPTAGTVDRAEDQHAKRIEGHPTDQQRQCEPQLEVETTIPDVPPIPANPRPRIEPRRLLVDSYPRGTFNRWCAYRDRATGRSS